jgi:uncharacterized membrane protein
MDTGEPETASAPPADGGVSQDDKTQAMLCWLLGIVIGVISPVIFMLVGKEKPFVYRNSMQCLTFHLVLIVISIVLFIISIPLAFVTCGLGGMIVFIPWIVGLIISIMGGMAANNGQVYEPPGTAGLAKSWFKV